MRTVTYVAGILYTLMLPEAFKKTLQKENNIKYTILLLEILTKEDLHYLLQLSSAPVMILSLLAILLMNFQKL